MSELPPAPINRKQVWEVANWKPEYEKVALSVVERFGEEYELSEEWEEVRESQLIPSIRGDRLDSVKFPAPGFYLMFIPHRIIYEDRDDATYWFVQDPRFQFANSPFSMPNFQSKMAVFQKNLRIMEDLVEEQELDMVMYPPMLIIPRQRFSDIVSVEIPAA